MPQIWQPAGNTARIANIARQRTTSTWTGCRTRKDAAPGIDAQTAANFEQELEVNLQTLLDRAKSGTYRVPPVRRVNIPKGDGKTRPIGIPTHEDKVLQRAVVMVLGPTLAQEVGVIELEVRGGLVRVRGPVDADVLATVLGVLEGRR